MKLIQKYNSVELFRLVILLFAFIFFSVTNLSAQTKGASPIVKSQEQIAKNIYAVVLGITDYQDPGIPDLIFKDKDAEANFLSNEIRIPHKFIALAINIS